MDQKDKGTSVTSDVLHFENQTKLTPEEIAKALAHHKKHDPAVKKDAAAAPAKKQSGAKAK